MRASECKKEFMSAEYWRYTPGQLQIMVVMDIEEIRGKFKVPLVWDGVEYDGSITKVFITETDQQTHTRVVECVGKIDRSWIYGDDDLSIYVGECELHRNRDAYYGDEKCPGVC